MQKKTDAKKRKCKNCEGKGTLKKGDKVGSHTESEAAAGARLGAGPERWTNMRAGMSAFGPPRAMPKRHALARPVSVF
jgi:hypothetical protein